ncbi:M15 family metallopeptidase [Winogradskyella ursingii]|uniref:M15 family metallopeptidase n=1 Tax=Winogradskyella ursingii TaxID=2686079 RepID=UPI0015C82C7C|nr:M15 family metallopeptidase [Winogradskyella ursingii]
MNKLIVYLAFALSLFGLGTTTVFALQSTHINNNLQVNEDFVLGKFDYKTHKSFTKVNSKFTSKPIYLQIKVYDAFLKMDKAAKKDGINLFIISCTRNFKEQKAIWERKWRKYDNLEETKRARHILEYSSMPSTSRHHWGTDLDLNHLTNSYFETGKGKVVYDWLTKNASTFGFYQVYTDKDNGRTGYNLEKWHWSYLPLAKDYLEFYNLNINYNDIRGFKGDHLAKNMKMIEEYVNGIARKAQIFN